MTINSPIQASAGHRTSRRQIKSVFLLLLITFWAPTLLTAANIRVKSISALQNAINEAAPGDVITLANGVYTTSGDITVSKTGTAARPITITAQTIGGAEISGAGGFHLVSPAAHIVIRGFRFTHASSKARMAAGSSFCRWTRNIFQTSGDGEYLTVNGDDHQVDYNTFQHKNAMGRFIAVRATGSQIARRLWVHHNYFYDFKSQGGAEVADGAKLTSHDRPDRVLIAHNTLVNNKTNIAMNHRPNGLGATSITLAYNIIQGGDRAATITGPFPDPQWNGNLLFGVGAAGDMPAGGFQTLDPKLVRDAAGTYHLPAGSPAIGMAKESYPAITVDMEGQPRTAPLDPGADEVSKAPVIGRILSPAMVGHTAKQ